VTLVAGGLVLEYPDAPWCWNFYLQYLAIVEINVGKYSSTMVHLGYVWGFENWMELVSFFLKVNLG
jgi:hypothetical protein